MSTYYFWKWAVNDVAGRPDEVHAALLRGQMHPATQSFDPALLVKLLEEDACHGRSKGEEWDWQIVWDQEPMRAKFVFATLPEPPAEEVEQERVAHRYMRAAVFGWSEELRADFAGSLPKGNVWLPGGAPCVWEPPQEVLPALIANLAPSGNEGYARMLNHKNDFIQIAALRGRYTVEWRECEPLEPWNLLELWHVRYRSPAQTLKGRAIQRRFVPEGLPVIRNYDGKWFCRPTRQHEFELISPSDVVALLCAFMRREPRPPFLEWVSLTEEMKHRPPESVSWDENSSIG